MSNSRRLFRVLAVLGMVLMLATGGALAAVSFDTETTNTATTSDITGGETVASFNASDTDRKFIEVTSGSDNPELRVEDNETGDVVATFGSGHADFEVTDSTNGHYAWNLTHEQLFGDVGIEAGETKDVNIIVVENASADTETTTTGTVTLQGTDERAVVHVGESFTNDTNAFESSTNRMAFGFDIPDVGGLGSEEDVADLQQDNIAINGTQTETVTFSLADANASGPFSDAASDADAGDWIVSQQVYVDGQPVAVYNDEAPDSVNTTGTYAVYDSAADEVVVHLGSEHDGKDAVDVHMVGNEKYSFSDRFDVMGLAAFTPFTIFGGLGLGALGAGAFVFGRPKIDVGA